MTRWSIRFIAPTGTISNNFSPNSGSPRRAVLCFQASTAAPAPTRAPRRPKMAPSMPHAAKIGRMSRPRASAPVANNRR
jgi:hypothetical protein